MLTLDRSSVAISPRSIPATGGDLAVSFRLHSDGAVGSFSTVYTLPDPVYCFANAASGDSRVLRIERRSVSGETIYRDILQVRAADGAGRPALLVIRLAVQELDAMPQEESIAVSLLDETASAVLPGRRSIAEEGEACPTPPPGMDLSFNMSLGTSEEVPIERARPARTRGGPSPAPALQETLEEVQFSAFAPRVVRPESWHTLVAYCHLPRALAEIEEDSQAVLRARERELRKSSSPSLSLIARDTEIVFVPQMAGCRFNPPRASVLWLEDWQRIAFRFRPSDGGAPGTLLAGAIRCFVGPVLIAEIPVQTTLLTAWDRDESPARATVQAYQSIFVSYSHRDALLVDQLEQAYTALGLAYLRDVRVLRSGQQWNEEILRKIEQADIFQLCWSTNASASPYVEQEWRHALRQKRGLFIRPMYWETPMPPAPPELSKLHFSRFQVALTPGPAAPTA